MPELPRLLTAHELAQELGQSRRWIYRMYEEKGLPAYKIGRSLLFSAAEVAAWLEAQRNPLNGNGADVTAPPAQLRDPGATNGSDDPRRDAGLVRVP